MEKKEIMSKLQDVFRDVFDNDEIVINENTVAEDIEEWDSLAHIQLASRIQDIFGIVLGGKEILSWDDVGEMAEAIQAKLK